MLYDESFINSIPCASSDERRSLVNLKAINPWLLQKFNIWYSELFPNGERELASRLRSIEDSESFTAGFWELVIYRHLKQTQHEVFYNQEINCKKPDLYWPKHDLIGDIVSISDPNYQERGDVFIHEVKEAINKLDLPFDVSILSFHFSGTSYRKRDVLEWIKSLSISPPVDLEDAAQEYDDGESRLEVLISPRTRGSVVKMVGMFSLNAEQLKKAVQGRIQKKLKKYQRPIIVFACSGQGFWSLQEDTLEMALYGDWQVIFSRDPNVREIREAPRATNGVFHNRCKNGLPANDRILAVVFADRLVINQRLYLRLKVFHNPYACEPLAKDFFGQLAQFVIIEDNGQEVTMGTINEGNKVVEIT